MNIKLRKYIQQARDTRYLHGKSRLSMLLSTALEVMRPIVVDWDAGLARSSSSMQYTCRYCGRSLSEHVLHEWSMDKRLEVSWQYLHARDCPLCMARQIYIELLDLLHGRETNAHRMRELESEVSRLREALYDAYSPKRR